MSEVYICSSCGSKGDLNEIHHEEIDGELICLECNSETELYTIDQMKEHEELLNKRLNNANNFTDALGDDL